jgi:hypothetical protein
MWLATAPTQAPVAVSISNPNLPPVANAGADITVAKGIAFTLSGAASADQDCGITTYAWSGSGVSAQRCDRPLIPLQPLVLILITLTVTDTEGATATDTVTVTVMEQAPRGDFREETIYIRDHLALL